MKTHVCTICTTKPCTCRQVPFSTHYHISDKLRDRERWPHLEPKGSRQQTQQALLQGPTHALYITRYIHVYVHTALFILQIRKLGDGIVPLM